MFRASQILAFMAVLLWSSAYVFSKVALEHFSGEALGFLRCSVACAVLAVVALVRRVPRPRLADMPMLTLSGACGFGVYFLVFNKGLETLNPTTSCLLVATAPILTACLARLLFAERLSRQGWLATLAAFGGVAVLFLWDGTFVLARGIGWTLLSAVLISLYNVLQRSLAHTYTALQITVWSFATATAMLCAFAPDALREAAAAPPAYTALACFLGVFPSAGAYLAWSKALALTGQTSSVTHFMFLTPFLALILDYLATGSLPGTGTFVGGAVILFSLALFFRYGRTPAAT